MRFVCVCCAGPALAAEFGQTLQLRTCVNTWVLPEHMPRWGQLGCNGLIVLDGEGRVACKRSPAYLDVREEAFRYVETLLSALVTDGTAAPSPAPKASESDGCGQLCSDGGGGGCDGGQCRLPFLPPEAEAGRAECAAPASPEDFASDVTPRVPSVPSVGVAVLDDQHAACAAALSALLAHPSSTAAARAVRSAYEVHFRTEEELLDAHVWPEAATSARKRHHGEPDGFSAAAGARRSHLADHKRLVDEVDALVALVQQAAEGGSAVDGDDTPAAAGALDTDTEARARAAAQRIASAFERHAAEYDGAYATELSKALAAAADAAARQATEPRHADELSAA